jgi:hypothetical protein
MRSALLLGLALVSLLALASLVLEFPGSDLVFAVSAFAFPPLLIGLGALRNGRLGGLAWPLLAFAAFLQACLLGMVWLSGCPDPRDWWFGLPPASAVMLGGLWLFPLLIVSFVYAWHFPRAGLTRDDLRRIRELAARRRTGDEDR